MIYPPYKNHKMYNTEKQRKSLFTCRKLMGEWRGGYIADSNVWRLRVGPKDIGMDFYPRGM